VPNPTREGYGSNLFIPFEFIVSDKKLSLFIAAALMAHNTSTLTSRNGIIYQQGSAGSAILGGVWAFKYNHNSSEKRKKKMLKRMDCITTFRTTVYSTVLLSQCLVPGAFELP
jgi:hypothetical protein